jgi:hypothetical protein
VSLTAAAVPREPVPRALRAGAADAPDEREHVTGQPVGRRLVLADRHLVAGLAHDGREDEHERVAPRLDAVVGALAQQGGVAGRPLAVAAAGDELEAGRAAAGEEQPGEVALGPAPAEVGAAAGDEQRDGSVSPVVRASRTGGGGPGLLALLVVLEQRR